MEDQEYDFMHTPCYCVAGSNSQDTATSRSVDGSNSQGTNIKFLKMQQKSLHVAVPARRCVLG